MQGSVRRSIPVLAGLVAAFLPATPASASTFTVDTPGDAVDAANGNGACATASGGCSLRAAIQEANFDADLDEIILPAGTFGISIGGIDDDNAATGDLDIKQPLTITGAGMTVSTVKGNDVSTVFHHQVNDPGAVTFRDLSIADGNGPAGGIEHGGTGLFLLERVSVIENVATSIGGGIQTDDGPLTIRDSVISGNHASLAGGGVYDSSATEPVTIERSTISGNTSMGGSPGGGVAVSAAPLTVTDTTLFDNEAASTMGGGLYVGATATITNATFTANSATSGAAMRVDGAADLTNVTMSGNTASGDRSIAVLGAGPVTLKNSVIESDGQNCSGAVTSGGGNVADDASCILTQPSDRPTTEPMLASLADNGGPTMTQALLAASPAIDRATSGCPSDDQRGAPRSSPTCDSGAYEVTTCMGTLVNRVGTAGDDALTGTPGDDGFLAQAGDDVVDAGDGDDRICAGAGNDALTAGGGADQADGEDGNDRFGGGGGNDSFLGRDGNDRGNGGAGKDTLSGHAGNDRLAGSGGADRLKGGPGKDTLNGGGGKDLCRGGGGKDRQRGC